MKKTKKLLSFFLAIMMVITAIPAFTLTASAAYSASDLKNIMTTFENKMADAKIYKNTKEGYNAYFAACKAYDAYYYGKNTSVDINTAATNLQNAINNMTEFTVNFTQVTPGGFNGDSTSYRYTLGTTHQNVLYSPKVTYQENTDYFFLRKVNSSASVDGNDINDIRLGYPTTVLFVDGVKTPKFPIFTYFKRADNGTIRIYQLYPAIETATTGLSSSIPAKSSYFEFKQNWKTQVQGSDYGTDYLTPWNAGTSAIEVNASSNPSTYTLTGYEKNWKNQWIPKWGRGANVLSYTGTPNSAMDKYTIKWFRHGGINSNSDMSDGNFGKKVSHAPMPIYVLNYKGIQDLLKTKKLGNISNYKENIGNKVVDNFSKYAELVQDYNALDYSKAETLMTGLNSKYDNLKSTSPTADPSDRYPAMRSAMDRSMAIFDGNNSDGKYTTSSFNEFKNAYQLAVNVMKSTASAGYVPADDAFTNTKQIADNLNTAIDHLVKRADFTNYNTAASLATTSIASYTNKDVALLPYSVMNNYSGVVDYRNGQDDIGDTQQTAINSSANKLVAANTAVATSDAISHEALQAFIKKYATCDTDVYKDPAVVTAQTDSANALYKTVTLFDTNYYSLDVANQSDLDNKITSYLNAINDENNIVTYNVTVPSGVSVVVRGATQTPVSSNTYNLICGENATFVNTGKADTAWYMEYTSNNAQRGNQYQAYGESFTTKIVGNMTVTAESYDTGKNCVSIVREYDKAGTGKAIDRVNFVADGDYTLPTPTKIANYNFIGYYINDVKIDTATIAINGDTNIVAKYQYAESDLTVKVNGTAKTYAYNESVSVRASGAYAWVEKTIGSETWRPFYIGSAVTFRATESTELKSVTQDEFNAMFTAEAFAPILRQNGVLVDADNRAVFHAQRIDYLPAGAQVVEFGILLNKASSTDFDLGNDKGVGQRNEKTVRLKSTQSLDKVQFNIFVKNAGSQAFTYKSYMIYKLADGTVETVYSDVFTKA